VIWGRPSRAQPDGGLAGRRYHNRGRTDHDRGNLGIMLAPLLGRGRIAAEVIGLLASTPGQELHTREIARRVKADAHPVQRALEQLVAAGLVQSRRLGNLRLWSVRQDSALLPAVRDIVRRSGGIAERLRRRLGFMRDASGVPVRLLCLRSRCARERHRPLHRWHRPVGRTQQGTPSGRGRAGTGGQSGRLERRRAGQADEEAGRFPARRHGQAEDLASGGRQ